MLHFPDFVFAVRASSCSSCRMLRHRTQDCVFPKIGEGSTKWGSQAGRNKTPKYQGHATMKNWSRSKPSTPFNICNLQENCKERD
ncbi:hypothetical protein M413DRAFT_206524 [Hebeloma cylindrosporum]|uniref:Uncharacterized protein n=1 Tax=Hebeloma cylindrosporum TaxID=76867 RepID=A0A0C3CV09_HEBCY|nr:hypothetical protein M413DRAFT_206524 [Hebeloma cylindrosporum h7]